MKGKLRRMHRALALTLAAVVYNNLTNLLPQGLHDVAYVPLNLSAGAAVALAAWWWLRLDRQSVGLPKGAVLKGLKWGTAAGLAIAVPLYVVLAVPPAREVLGGDARAQELTVAALLYATVVRIPLGTALFEEWVFRGVLYGAWLRSAGPRTAWLVPSAAFGLWHIAPSLEALAANRPDAGVALAIGFVAGSVIATAAAGLLFTALRVRSGGVIAPVVAHGLINSLALLVAWLAR